MSSSPTRLKLRTRVRALPIRNGRALDAERDRLVATVDQAVPDVLAEVEQSASICEFGGLQSISETPLLRDLVADPVTRMMALGIQSLFDPGPWGKRCR